MQRRSYVPGAVLLTALLTAGLTGCTGASDGDTPEDSKPGGPSASAPDAEPGRYRTLPEPCGAVSTGTLRAMLPGIDDLTQEERKKAYDGQAAVTFDTDRRVGCRWKSVSDAGTRHLNIDFERIVSYDAAVSDDDRAQELYDRKATAAGIPAASPSGGQNAESQDKPSASASESAAEGADKAEGASRSSGTDKSTGRTGGSGGSGASADGNDASEDAARKDGASAEPGAKDTAKPGAKDGSESGGKPGSGSSSAPADAGPDTAPRPLDDLADVAYLDDRLATADSGVHRDVTVVFRASNVIVTVEYDQWSATQSDQPDSQDLQSKAQRLAQELVGRISE
ncbi:hypothetical protein [Streptomyces sp. bgisy100]|uniref:hypothetical protein n=1 Tax=Streptomyces sp. bgisy100 TaxID=3413783 RepID=UPI003D70B6E6